MKNKKLFAARLIFTVLSILTVGMIFYNSSMSAVDSSDLSGTVVTIINGFFRLFDPAFSADEFFVRKTAHFTEYFVLGVMLSITLYLYLSKRLRTFLFTVPIGLAVSVCDEFIQTLAEGRSCEFRDMMIDLTGVLCAALIVQLVLYLIIGRKKEGNEIERTDAK